MSRRKWILLIVLSLGLFVYFNLFYKTWSEQAVPANADCIAAIDVKRVTNTLLWNFLTSPGQWKPGKLFSKSPKDTGWKDMFAIPDYLFPFHVKDQPADNWYLVLDKKNESGFAAGLQKFAFEKQNDSEFISREKGLYLFALDKKVLLARADPGDSNLIRNTARELFADKHFFNRSRLAKAVDAASHLAVYIEPGNILKDAGLITANFNKQQIRISGNLVPMDAYKFAEEGFLYAPSALLSVGFTQPAGPVLSLLGRSGKDKLSKALSLETDSLFVPTNRSYSLSLADIRERSDTAISYTYDEEFNKVEKAVVNKIQEPSFVFFVNGAGVPSVYGYLKRNGKLETTATGDVFLPMPLVRSYCEKRSPTSMAITSFNYSKPPIDASTKAVLFFHCGASKLPANLYKYLPGVLSGMLANMDEISVTVSKENSGLKVTGMLTKRESSASLFSF